MTDQNKIELDELLPCPFCGKKPKFVNQPYKNGVCISCKNPKCDVQSSAYHYYNKGAVLFAWNTRAPPPSHNKCDRCFGTKQDPVHGRAHKPYGCVKCGGSGILFPSDNGATNDELKSIIHDLLTMTAMPEHMTRHELTVRDRALKAVSGGK